MCVYVNQSGELRQFGDTISRRLGCRFADEESRKYLHFVRFFNTHDSLNTHALQPFYDFFSFIWASWWSPQVYHLPVKIAIAAFLCSWYFWSKHRNAFTLHHCMK